MDHIVGIRNTINQSTFTYSSTYDILCFVSYLSPYTKFQSPQTAKTAPTNPTTPAITIGTSVLTATPEVEEGPQSKLGVGGFCGTSPGVPSFSLDPVEVALVLLLPLSLPLLSLSELEAGAVGVTLAPTPPVAATLKLLIALSRAWILD